MKGCRDVKVLLVLRPADRTAEEEARLAAHLATCPACAALAQAYAEQDDALRNAPAARLTRAQKERVRARVKRAKRWRRGRSRWSEGWNSAALTPVLVGVILGLGLMLGARFLLEHGPTRPAVEAPTGPTMSVEQATTEQPTVTTDAPASAPVAGPTTAHTSTQPTPLAGVDAVLDCAAVYPGMPGCLRDEPLVSGQLAFVDERAPFDNRPTIVGLDTPKVLTLGEAPDQLRGWSPSGAYLLTRRAVYRADGTRILLLDGSDGCRDPMWAPPTTLTDPRDHLICQTTDGGLVARTLPDLDARVLTTLDASGLDGPKTILFSTEGSLAWTPNLDTLAEVRRWRQELYVLSSDADGDPTVISLSDDIRTTYYQLIDWVPGTRLLLAGRGMLTASLWVDGVPLVTIDTDSGEVTEVGVSMLLTPEAYAWHPSRPGLLAVAAGAGRFINANKRLAILDVLQGKLTYLTDEDRAAFAPTWSPDGTWLAYAAVPASPKAEGDGDTMEQTLEGRAIYAINLSTGEQRTLTKPGQAIDAWPRWSVDGQQQLLYTRQSDGQTDVRATTLEGSSDVLLLTGLPDITCFHGGCGWASVLAYAPTPPLTLPPTDSTREETTLNRIIRGTIVEIRQDTLILEHPERGQITVRLSPETRIWKGGWDSERPLEIGDEVVGTGEPNAELTVWDAESLEVNVVFLRGELTRVAETPDGMEVELQDTRDAHVYTVRIPEKLLTEQARLLAVGDDLEVAGLRLDDGTVLAETLFLPSATPIPLPSGAFHAVRVALAEYDPLSGAQAVVDALAEACAAWLSEGKDPAALQDALRAPPGLGSEELGTMAPVVRLIDLNGDGSSDVVIEPHFIGLPVLGCMAETNGSYGCIPLPSPEGLGDNPLTMDSGVLTEDLTADGRPETVITYTLQGGSGWTELLYIYRWEQRLPGLIFHARLINWAGRSTWSLQPNPRGAGEEIVLTGPHLFEAFDHKLTEHPLGQQVWRWDRTLGRFVKAAESLSLEHGPEGELSIAGRMKAMVNDIEGTFRAGQYREAAERYLAVTTLARAEDWEPGRDEPDWVGIARFRRAQAMALLSDGRSGAAAHEMEAVAEAYADDVLGELAATFLAGYEGRVPAARAIAAMQSVNLYAHAYHEVDGALAFPVDAGLLYPAAGIAAYLNTHPELATNGETLAGGLREIGYDVAHVDTGNTVAVTLRLPDEAPTNRAGERWHFAETPEGWRVVPLAREHDGWPIVGGPAESRYTGEWIEPEELRGAGEPSHDVDLTDMDVESWSDFAPEGRWVAEGLVAYPTSARGGSEYYQQLVVRERTGTLEHTVIDTWAEWLPGHTTPSPIGWSDDGGHFYFTNRPHPDGCPGMINGSDLQRLDVQTGAVTELLAPSSFWVSLSPDQRTLAYITWRQEELVLRDLEGGGERRVELDPGEDFTAGEIVWSPDGKRLALTIGHRPCDGAWAAATSVLVVDVTTGENRTLLDRDERLLLVTVEWTEAGILLAAYGSVGDPSWILDPGTGLIVRR